MLDKFKKSQKQRSDSKKEIEKKFIENHFSKHFEKTGQTIEAWLKTINPNASIFMPKTINTAYIKKISVSDTFLRDFSQYLHYEFMENYKESVEPKINKFIEKCYEQAGNSNSAQTKIQEYVEDNPKCKFPWTQKELNNAKQAVCDLVNKHVKM